VTLKVSEKNRVLHIVLNRPEKRNALTSEMSAKLGALVNEAQERPEIGVILISAAGAVFCSGMDLEEASGADHRDLTAAHEKLFTMGARSGKPIVIAVQGAALGGGLGLVAQGHLVIGGEGASFGLPEIRVGFWPFLVYRSVEAALGRRRMLALSLTGERFFAQQAFEWGLVHELCPQAELTDRSQAAAQAIANASPLAISVGMRYVRESHGKSWDEAGQIGAKLRAQLITSEDFKEGRLAFKQRRDPVWPSLSDHPKG
jgi:enoyl-CoA hydratase/carnithine racemase